MPRWQPDAQTRLQEAALALFEERGYDETTVAKIAERAGLTKRTFFRYFADKREVLFWGAENIEDLFSAAIHSATAAAPPLDAVGRGLEAFAARLDEQGEVAARRIRIVRASPELWERQLVKFASIAEAAARALRSRGVSAEAAVIAGETGMAVFRVAAARWLDEADGRPFAELIVEALAQLRALASPYPGSSFPSSGRRN
jgi:AcrR family transcriptional regulator